MGRAPCCDKANVKKGPWSPEEDAKLKHFIHTHGSATNWISLPHKAGLRRCGKSCRLRWLNYLRPNIKHGHFTDEEDRIICTLFTTIGTRWSIIAAHLPGRTDNDIKNYWNTKLKKKLMMGMVPIAQMKPNSFFQASSSSSPAFLSPEYQNFAGISNCVSFAGEGSCSSSDGSFSNGGSGRIEGGDREMGQFQSYFHGGVEEQKVFSGEGMIGEDGYWRETALDQYGFEEIKRLISGGSWSNSNLSFDECKTENKVLYF